MNEILDHSIWNVNNSFTGVRCFILAEKCIAGKNEIVSTLPNSTAVSSCHSNEDTKRPRYCSFSREKKNCKCEDYTYEQECKNTTRMYCDEEKKSCDCTEGSNECKPNEIWVGGTCVSGIHMMIYCY